MKKILIGIVALVVIAITGLSFGGEKVTACGFWTPCEGSNVDDSVTENTQRKGAIITEKAQRALMQAVPVPEVTTSEERKNLVRRLEIFNSENKISYIYLINYGKVMAFYSVKGKVSSVNSYLTTSVQLVDRYGNDCGATDYSSTYNRDCYTVDSPDLDGSYGENPEAIFFFTTEDAYVEWKGDYMMSDQPLKLTTQPELVT